MKKSGTKVVFMLVILLVAAAIWGIYAFLDWEKPQIIADKSIATIGQLKLMDIRFIDEKTGLRHISITLSQDNISPTLSEVDFQEKGTVDKTLHIEVIPKNLKIHDGEAMLHITATDFSPLKNTASLDMQVTIDAVPPRISLQSASHNINPGGTCLSIYKVSKPVHAQGVKCGDAFFPGYPTTFKDKPCSVAYFAVPMNVQRSTLMSIMVQDRGGNTAAAAIPFYIRTAHTFRSDTVKLGETFLQEKAVEFQQHEPRLAGKTPVDIFMYVNEQMRQDNSKTIQTICSKTQPKQLWQGPFLRMKNAAPMARFGDKRGYAYEGRTVGESVHLGVDLASTMHAPVQAANRGVVLFTDYLGIYGNAVIIDHGQGIASLYGHMNESKVKVGQQVAKGEVIGITGSTGLAGGDHLHFSILVGGQFVNPIEWWDSHWITDNIENKLNDAASLF